MNSSPDLNDLKAIADKVFTKVQSAFPESLAEDAKQNIQAVISSALQELNVVSKEELDTQVAVLARTRAKLEELEQKVTQLEGQISKKTD
jgi:BMFP domain-containing protein YqiC